MPASGTKTVGDRRGWPLRRIVVHALAIAALASVIVPLRATRTPRLRPAAGWPVAQRPVAILADLDGDGIADHADLPDSLLGYAIRVRLSTRPVAEVITSPTTIVAIAAVDVDRDGIPDLVASTSDGLITVWRNGIGSFVVLPPRAAGPHLLAPQVAASSLGLRGAVATLPRSGVSCALSASRLIFPRIDRYRVAGTTPSRPSAPLVPIDSGRAPPAATC